MNIFCEVLQNGNRIARLKNKFPDEIRFSNSGLSHTTRSRLNLVPEEYRYNDAINQIYGVEKPISQRYFFIFSSLFILPCVFARM